MARMEQVSLMELGKLAAEGQTEAEVFAQISQCAQKLTKSNKPYLDVTCLLYTSPSPRDS